MIYIIRAGADGPVKIGYAVTVARRLALLQTGNHERFTLLRTLPGGRKTEAWLHRRFAAARIDREWFGFDAAMLECVPPTPNASGNDARVLLSRFGKLPHVRAALQQVRGVKPPTIQALSAWQQNNRIPARWQRPLLDAAVIAEIKISADELVSVGQTRRVA